MQEKKHALRTPDSAARHRAPIVVQRKCGCGGLCGPCADEKKKKVQRHALGETTTEIPRSVGSILGSAGHPLDADTRASMESRFGRSLADVRVHTDTHAAESAKEINAAAYTSGTHIVFGAGRFAPHTTSGRRLLAHELAHVMQQRSGTALPNGVGPADDVHERAADRVADLVVAQGPAFAPPPAIAPIAERLRVQRKAEPGELLDEKTPERFANYLAELDRTGEPQRASDSDDKARQIIRKWRRGDPRFLLTARRKAVLIRQLMTGRFSILDQRAVLNLLERSSQPDLLHIFGGEKEGRVRHEDLLSKFDGRRRRQLWSFYRRRFNKAFSDPVLESEASYAPAPPLTPPDPTLLAQTGLTEEGYPGPGVPTENMVSLGEPRLPKSTRPEKQPSKLAQRIAQAAAIKLVEKFYDGHLDPAGIERAKRTKLVRAINSEEFAEKLAEYCGKPDIDCSSTDPKTVMGFFDDTLNPEEIVLNVGIEGITLLHEVVHSFGDPRVKKAIHTSFREGIAEYLTRRIVLRQGGRRKRRLAITPNEYDVAFDKVQELVLVVGETLVVRAFFKGEIEQLQTAIAERGKSGEFAVFGEPE